MTCWKHLYDKNKNLNDMRAYFSKNNIYLEPISASPNKKLQEYNLLRQKYSQNNYLSKQYEELDNKNLETMINKTSSVQRLKEGIRNIIPREIESAVLYCSADSKRLLESGFYIAKINKSANNELYNEINKISDYMDMLAKELERYAPDEDSIYNHEDAEFIKNIRALRRALNEN